MHMRVVSSLIAALCLSAFPVEAQEAVAPVVFSDGLSLQLPPGWRTMVLETNAPLSTTRGFENTKVLTLLMSARPASETRTASLTIVRDESIASDDVGPAAQEKMRVRLGEYAALQGFKINGFNIRGATHRPENVILAEAAGVSSDGRRRIFACLGLNSLSGPSLRCYWDYDEMDVAALGEFNAMLASMSLKGVRVSESLAAVPPSKVAGNDRPPRNLPPADPSMSQAPSVLSVPSLPPVPVSPVPALPSPESGELVSKNRNALVVIEGTKGTGSGFLCQLDGQPSLLTNIHVLADNPQPRFSTMSGTAITIGPAFLGVDRDIFKASIPPGSTLLEAMSDLDATAKIGDAIVVLGNAEGAGVIRPLEGRIVGIGPSLVEVDAPFVSGNSGSPIIHIATGKVIGIATYLIIRKVTDPDGGKVESVVRRFGYRLDNVRSWEPVNWPLFYAQSAQAAAIEDNGEEFIKLFSDSSERNLSSANYRYPGIKRALYTMESAAANSRRMSDADILGVRRKLLSDLRTASVSDIAAFNSKPAYDFFRRQVAEQKKLRDEIYNYFSRIMESKR